ncbi:MAG: bifunctional helix-turn-helix domain-containing protein/methylated-DNA--[protein]-cysteine S-methyltransferase [Acidobacteria bacterium]|nr:bifunctional helix-turn-helix domain-containing protein/methylated-DNA--[protein]-cysteine S-methyltransferase [Acidobacteriota bacterium]
MGLSDYSKVERALHFIAANRQEQPSLHEVSAEVGLSEFHFQRLFQRWAGVSPKRFLQYLTLQEAKRLLHESRSVLETSLEVGYSSSSRLHDLFVAIEKMTPGEYSQQASGLTIHWGIAETPFGPAIFAALDRGLCGMEFVGEDGTDAAVQRLRMRWPRAEFVPSQSVAERYANLLSMRLKGNLAPLGLVLKGTPFQLQAWEALLKIPHGQVISYGDLAKLSGTPSASRAIGAAVGHNPIAVFIPCHRVIQSSGGFGQYHWGCTRKMAIIGYERSHQVAS